MTIDASEGGGLLDDGGPRTASTCFTSSMPLKLPRPFILSSFDGGDEDRRRAEGESGARGDRGDGGRFVGARKDILEDQMKCQVSEQVRIRVTILVEARKSLRMVVGWAKVRDERKREFSEKMWIY